MPAKNSAANVLSWRTRNSCGLMSPNTSSDRDHQRDGEAADPQQDRRARDEAPPFAWATASNAPIPRQSMFDSVDASTCNQCMPIASATAR